MYEEIATKWTDRLRSDDVRQGKGFLTQLGQNGEEYDCCLGVLCKLAREAGLPLGRKEILSPSGGMIVEYAREDEYGLRYDLETSVLPRIVMEWAGIGSDDGAFMNNGESDNLASLNDGDALGLLDGLTFPEIADVIDKYWVDL
jgi:hypothetical protein